MWYRKGITERAEMTDHRDCLYSSWVTAAPLPDTLPCMAVPGYGLPAQLQGYITLFS